MESLTIVQLTVLVVCVTLVAFIQYTLVKIPQTRIPKGIVGWYATTMLVLGGYYRTAAKDRFTWRKDGKYIKRADLDAFIAKKSRLIRMALASIAGVSIGLDVSTYVGPLFAVFM